MINIKECALLVLGAVVFVGAMSWSGNTRPASVGDLFAQAEARVGRPLTPVSVAGVARRPTRRVAYTGAAAAAAAPPPTTTVVVAPKTCTQVVDANGVVTQVCQ